MPLNIEYLGCEYGCIEAKFMGENGEYIVDISAVYDPFDDWFFALENIDRLCPPHIVINPEDEELSINLRDELDDSRFSITIIGGQSKGEKVFVCKTTPKEIIEQMYVKLMAFVHSDKYNPKDYEDKSSWGGFALSTYHNATLDKYARFGIKPFYERANCHFCGSKMHIYTIDDMLDRAYTIISANKKLISFLKNIGQSKESIGICQNYSRFIDFFESEFEQIFAKNFDGNFTNSYRTIQATNSGIYLCFSEDFSVLEKIEVEFIKNPITHLSYAEQMRFLRDFFGCFVEFANDIDECIEPNRHSTGNFFVIKKDGKVLRDNESSAIYPNRDKEYFVFERVSKSDMISKVTLRLTRRKPINAPLSLWLNQKIIRIMPDFTCYLWDNAGFGIDLDSLIGYENLHESELGKALDAWGSEFDSGALDKDFDWKSFNEKGRKLWHELQNLIKEHYIVIYDKSFEKEYGAMGERFPIDKYLT